MGLGRKEIGKVKKRRNERKGQRNNWGKEKMVVKKKDKRDRK